MAEEMGNTGGSASPATESAHTAAASANAGTGRPFGRTDGNIGDWTRRLRREPSVVHAQSGAQADVHPLDAIATDSVVGFAAEHVRRYIASAGQDDGWDGPKPILILYTKGRKSGQLRRNPLLFFEHLDARYIVGSKGGDAQHPGWFLNLQADAHVHVRVMAEFYEATAVPVDAEVRAWLWLLVVQRYAMFADYQASTARQIPLVQLLRAPT